MSLLLWEEAAEPAGIAQLLQAMATEGSANLTTTRDWLRSPTIRGMASERKPHTQVAMKLKDVMAEWPIGSKSEPEHALIA